MSDHKGERKPGNEMSAETSYAKEELMAVLDAVEKKVEEADKECVENEETDEAWALRKIPELAQ